MCEDDPTPEPWPIQANNCGFSAHAHTSRGERKTHSSRRVSNLPFVIQLHCCLDIPRFSGCISTLQSVPALGLRSTGSRTRPALLPGLTFVRFVSGRTRGGHFRSRTPIALTLCPTKWTTTRDPATRYSLRLPWFSQIAAPATE